MQIIVHSKVPELAGLRQQWNVLLQTMESPQVFYTYEWAAALSHAYGASMQPLFFTAHDADKLTGVVAFALDPAGKLGFLSASTADYCDFISKPEDRQEFIEEVMLELRRIGAREICLANVPADSASGGTLAHAAARAGYSAFKRPAYHCAQVRFASTEDRIKIRSSAENRLKKISRPWIKRGQVTVSHTLDMNEFISEFCEFSTAHVERFL